MADLPALLGRELHGLTPLERVTLCKEAIDELLIGIASGKRVFQYKIGSREVTREEAKGLLKEIRDLCTLFEQDAAAADRNRSTRNLYRRRNVRGTR